MKVPIPSDWNGEDWECVQIQWPDSPQFWGLLTGLLSLMTRGRYWEENTGQITDIQLIAWEIFDRNYPFIGCDGGIVTPLPPEIIQCFSGGGDDEREDDMGNFITNITCEDGVMYLHYGPCCKIPTTCDFSTIAQPPPPGTNPDPEDPTTWACNKSYGMAITFFDVIVEVVAAISPFSNVYEMYSPCYNVLKRFGAVWGNAQQVCAAYIADKSAIDVLVADPETPQKMACTWSPLLLPTDNLNSDEFWSMQTSFPVKFTEAQNTFLVPMTIAMGLSNFAWWARLFYSNEADCDCPPGPPVAGSIFFNGDYTGPLGGDFSVENSDVQYGGRRMRLHLACFGSGNKNFTDLEYELEGAVGGDYLTIRVYPETRVPANENDIDTETIVESQWMNCDIDGSPEPTVRNEYAGYVEHVMPYDVTNLPQYFEMWGWKYPISEEGAETYIYYIEIVAINGVDLGPIGP